MIYCGCDPGSINGALGVIDDLGGYIDSWNIEHKDKHILALAFKSRLLGVIDPKEGAEICMEQVHSMPGQGVASTFKFGRAVGAIDAVADMMFGVWHIVSPQRWKKSMGVTQDKLKSLNLARELWPNAPLSRMKDHGRAEALLIAEYLRRTHG